MQKTGAVVVGYKPDTDTLNRLLVSLRDQVETLIFVDNGGCDHRVLSLIRESEIVYIDMEGNKGLGAALNAGFSAAVCRGAEYVVTFDQDSEATPHLIADLATGMQAARAMDTNCIAVSPVFFDRRSDAEVNFPFYQTKAGKIYPTFEADDANGLVPADVLITSGMYVRTAAWVDGLKYNEALFVDATDSEWCFRARHQGYTIYGYTKAKMGHALSDAPPITLFGLSFFRYTPIRRYFYFRNMVAVSFNKTTPGQWKRRMLIGLLLRFFVNVIIDARRMRSLAMMCRGIYHGIKQDLGPLH